MTAQHTAPPPETTTPYTAEPRLRQLRSASGRYRGAGTGTTYVFTASEPVQRVHPADVDSLLRTGLFRIAP